MIKDIKMGWQLLRYTYGLKTAIIFSILLLAIGIFFLVAMPQESGTGPFFIVATAMWPIQMLYSVVVPDIVQTSPWKKAIQTKVMAWMGMLSFLAMMLLIIVLELIMVGTNCQNSTFASTTILNTGVYSFMLLLFMCGALKYFWQSTIVLMLMIYPYLYVVNLSIWVERFGISLPIAVVLCCVMIFLGGLANYGLSLLLYRKPVAKSSQLTALKKTM